MLNPGDIISVANERLRVEAVAPRVKLRSLSSPTVTRYPTLAFVEERGVVVERAPVAEEPGAYVLTAAELDEALRETCRMAREYWNVRGLDAERGASAAASEMLARLDAAREVPSRG